MEQNRGDVYRVGIEECGRGRIVDGIMLVTRIRPFAYMNRRSFDVTMKLHSDLPVRMYFVGDPRPEDLVEELEVNLSQGERMVMVEQPRNETVEIDGDLVGYDQNPEDLVIRAMPVTDHRLTEGEFWAYIGLIGFGTLAVSFLCTLLAIPFIISANGARASRGSNTTDNRVWTWWGGTTLIALAVAVGSTFYFSDAMFGMMAKVRSPELEQSYRIAIGIADQAPPWWQSRWAYILGFGPWEFWQVAGWYTTTAIVAMTFTVWDDFQASWRYALRRARRAADIEVTTSTRMGFGDWFRGITQTWVNRPQPPATVTTTTPGGGQATAHTHGGGGMSAFTMTLLASLIAELPHLLHQMFERR